MDGEFSPVVVGEIKQFMCEQKERKIMKHRRSQSMANILLVLFVLIVKSTKLFRFLLLQAKVL